MIKKEISLIIPYYNRYKYITECIKSILKCNINEIKIIVSDDGSADNAGDSLKLIGPPVEYIWMANAGVSAARNAGYAASCGRYIAFLDCDDQWIAGGPERLIRVLDEHPEVSVVFGDAMMGRFEDGFESFVTKFGRDEFQSITYTRLGEGVRLLRRRPFLHRMARRNVVFLGSLLMRREVFEEIGGFEPRLSGAADWEFLLRIASRYEFAYCEETPVAIYLQHAGGMSNDREEMDREFNKALVSVMAKETLDSEDRRAIAAQIARNEFSFGYRDYDRGNFISARNHLRRSLKNRFCGRALALWLACCLPHGVVRRARVAKRRVFR